MGNFLTSGCRLFIGIFFMAVLLPSCSVKEGREDCPCLLEIDPGAFLTEGPDPDFAVIGENGKVTLTPRDGLLIARVSKGMFNLSAVSCGAGTLLGKEQISTIRDKEPDSLFACSGTPACLGESLRVRPVPEKQFCTVTLQIGSAGPGDFHFQLRSPCDGLKRFTLTPTQGYHTYSLEESGTGLYRFRVLRQDGSEGLTIRVVPEEGLIRELPLGRIMKEAGYDWSLKDLDDFYLKFDPVLSTIQVRISGWETEKTIEITL